MSVAGEAVLISTERREADEFADRALMSLVMEAAELKENTARMCLLLTTLAAARGISTDV